MLYDRSSRTTTSRAPSVTAASAGERMNGRVKASTSRASAAQRSSSRNQWRIRCRRNEWNGMRRTNISEGNSMTSFRSRWIM